MKLETVRIQAEDTTLAGLSYVPEGRLKTTALLFTHGFTSGKYSMDSLAGYLAARGYPGLTFDLVGHKAGGTGGEMLRTIQSAENVRDAVVWMRANLNCERIVLVGHSMGAAASLQAGAWEQDRPGIPPLAGVVSICMGMHPASGFQTQIGKAMLAQRHDYVRGAPALELLEGLNEMVHAASKLAEIPAMFVAARQDVLLPVANVEALASLTGPNATIAVLDASHLDAPDRSRAAVIQWLESHAF